MGVTEMVEILFNMVKESSTIVAITDPDNTYSRKILLKKGFESVKQYRNDDDEPAELFIMKRRDASCGGEIRFYWKCT